MLLRLSSDFRRAMDLSLVLEQAGIPHELRRVGDAHWALQIEEKDAARAETAAAAFELENPPEVRRPEVVHPITGAVASGVAFSLAVVAMYVRTGPESAGSPWFERGSADAAAILRGEWWRAVTALTLHADAAHVAGNAVLGGLLLALLARSVGPGMASALMLLSGVGGTFATAGLLRHDFVSIGASTAVSGLWASWQPCHDTPVASGCPSSADWRCWHSSERRSAPTSPAICADSCPGCWPAQRCRACQRCKIGPRRRVSRSSPRACRWPHGSPHFASPSSARLDHAHSQSG